MAQTQGYDFSKLPTALMQVFDGKKEIITDVLTDGDAKIRELYNLLVTDNKSPLVNLQIMDILRAASDDFTPSAGALQFGARIPTFEDVDIDLQFTTGEIQTLYRSYLQYVKGLSSEKEVLANPFDVFFLEQILRQARANLVEKASWKAVKNASNTGSVYSITGLLSKVTAARTALEIPAAQVFTAATTIDDTNSYEQAISMCQLVEAQNQAMLEIPLQFRCSPGMARSINRRRQAKFPNLVRPNEVMRQIDNYENITITPDVGLTGKSTMLITPGSNLNFVCNEDVSAYTLTVVKDVKAIKINIRMSVGFDFGFGKFMFPNDKV
ncbi:hypothetical protein GO730_05865 [Spirosoma sp. HMF3257]|uniref:Phage major capsid protein n=1 Tax=Spirosoma telluris TaxID=2183553 RepID=A0A327NFJ4_9BACT|nr:hypothetical protein [Spirosoma telluris]RAI74002.1 hypothetical protein HMF3257_05820 [Spirosoma telluris]